MALISSQATLDRVRWDGKQGGKQQIHKTTVKHLKLVVENRAEGVVQFWRFDYTDPVSGRRRREVVPGGLHAWGTIEPKATEWNSSILNEKVAPVISMRSGGPTLAEVLDLYLAHLDDRCSKPKGHADHISRSAAGNYRKWVEHVCHFLGGRAVASVTKQDVIELFNGITTEHGEASANATVEHLKRMWVLFPRVAPRLVPEGLPFPCSITSDRRKASSHDLVLHPKRPRNRVLSFEELDRLFTTIREQVETAHDAVRFDRQRMEAIVRLHYHMGARSQDVMHLQWSRINWETGEVVIPASLTKTGKQYTYYLQEEGLQVLREWDELRKAEGILSPWVFPSEVDLSRPGAYPQAAWQTAAKAAGLYFAKGKRPAHVPPTFENIRPHDLRRSRATHLLRAGMPMEVVSKMLNHSSIAVTQRHYASLDNDTTRSSVQQFAALLKEQREQARGNVVNL